VDGKISITSVLVRAANVCKYRHVPTVI